MNKNTEKKLQDIIAKENQYVYVHIKLKSYETLILKNTLYESWEAIDTDRSIKDYTKKLLNYFQRNAGHWVEAELRFETLEGFWNVWLGGKFFFHDIDFIDEVVFIKPIEGYLESKKRAAMNNKICLICREKLAGKPNDGIIHEACNGKIKRVFHKEGLEEKEGGNE